MLYYERSDMLFGHAHYNLGVSMHKIFYSDYACAEVVGTDAHILAPSRSPFKLVKLLGSRSYCCLCPGCGGHGNHVKNVIRLAKEAGATQVILDAGPSVREFGGLPVSDVSNHIGWISEYLWIRKDS